MNAEPVWRQSASSPPLTLDADSRVWTRVKTWIGSATIPSAQPTLSQMPISGGRRGDEGADVGHVGDQGDLLAVRRLARTIGASDDHLTLG
jgi:hypothetical protein